MCHTAINALGGSSESQAFQGGLIPMQNWYAPSLTSNKEAGLGDWSIEDISDLLRTGISHRGAVYGPMAEVVYNSLQYMTDEDIRAMAVYLKSLAGHAAAAATSNIPGAGKQPPNRAGQDIYDDQCASLPRAARARKAAALSAARRQSVDPDGSAVNPIRMVLNGGFPPGNSWQSHAVRHAAFRPVAFR